jgi:transcriptional regulator with XRE-family HTH domain
MTSNDAKTPRRRAEGPDPVDVHVGQRLRHIRMRRGLSQEALGDRIGVTFQQLQKYERGANRISASRLFHLSQVLDVAVSYFFDELGTPQTTDATTVHGDPMSRRETLLLVGAYYRLPERIRRQFLHLLREVAGNADDASRD